ncbi:hypothetical protein GB937_010859 [Aspergillus fischeri]|nr:hypothetical protein GB937_010859 [Aspergillus fischeri]
MNEQLAKAQATQAQNVEQDRMKKEAEEATKERDAVEAGGRGCSDKVKQVKLFPAYASIAIPCSFSFYSTSAASASTSTDDHRSSHPCRCPAARGLCRRAQQSYAMS